MFGLGDYIILLALIHIPLSICGNLISASREENKSINVIKFIIYSSIFAIFIGTALTPMIMTAFLQSKIFNRIILCFYLIGNVIIHLRFMQKKVNGNMCIGKCKILKDIWLCGIITYTVLLGFCLFKVNSMVILFAAIIYAIYCISILAFDYYFEEKPNQEFEEIKYSFMPLRQLSIEQYRAWERKRELNVRKRMLIIAAVYQGVFVILILAAAKNITLVAILILALLCSLTLVSIAFAWNKRLKEIESMQIESVYRGRGMVETMSPLRIRYMDSEGEYQSRVVEKKQRRKEKQGTMVDIIVENGEIVLAEKKLPE